MTQFPQNADRQSQHDALPLQDSPHLLDEHGPVFIMGCPRSGTTFLSVCLAAIEPVELFTGVLVAPRMMHFLGLQRTRGQEATNRLLMRCVRDTFWQAHWRRRLRRGPRFAEVLERRNSLRTLLKQPTVDGSLFCFKEPMLCFAALDFAHEFPNARFIHVIRDGRDSADSLERCYPDALSQRVLRSEILADRKNTEIGIWRRVGDYCIPWWLADGDVERFIDASQYARCVWLWREMVERGRELGRLVGHKRYFECRYEQLATSPSSEADRLLEFLGCGGGYRFRRAIAKARPDSLQISHRRQSKQKLREAEELAGVVLKELGYV